jgi:hypothetical protein
VLTVLAESIDRDATFEWNVECSLEVRRCASAEDSLEFDATEVW